MQKGLGELKQFLPHNYRQLAIAHFAEKHKYHPNYVSSVASGKLTNWKMLDYLRTLAEENMKVSNKVIDSNKRIKSVKI
jgi:hypothetical protein